VPGGLGSASRIRNHLITWTPVSGRITNRSPRFAPARIQGMPEPLAYQSGTEQCTRGHDLVSP